MWILLLILPPTLQSITSPETDLISHYLCSVWFPLHSLLRYLHFNLEDSLWSFSIHLSITTASQISQDLCRRVRFWRINLLHLSTFSKPLILHPNANEHMPHPDWCEVYLYHQVCSCPPNTSYPGVSVIDRNGNRGGADPLSLSIIPTFAIPHSSNPFSTFRIMAENSEDYGSVTWRPQNLPQMVLQYWSWQEARP